MSKLDEVISKINKEYGFNMIGGVEAKTKQYRTFTPTTPALSYIFHGDMPRTIYILVGEFSSGKSSLSYMMCGAIQKKLKQEWQDEIDELEQLSKPSKEQQLRLSYLKERGHQRVAYLDIEFTSNEEWMSKNGVDIDDLIFIAPENQTAEQLFQICLDLIASDGIGYIVIDSVPALTSKLAQEKTMEDKTYGGISQPMSVFCSKLLPLCNKHSCGFTFIVQPRDDMAGFNRVIYNGGKMMKHTASVIMYLKRGTLLDSNFNDLKSHPDEASGNMVEVEILKNKATKPDRRMCKFTIDYSTGIDGINDTITMAIGFGIIIRTGAWYSFKDYKWQGKANVVKELREDKELCNEIYELVMEECRK